jgi:hypothetical protein
MPIIYHTKKKPTVFAVKTWNCQKNMDSIFILILLKNPIEKKF